MVSEQLLNYIKTQQAAGYSKDAVSSVLLQSGYSQADIDAAFTTLSFPSVPPPQPIQSPQTSSPQAFVYTDPSLPTTTNMQNPATPSYMSNSNEVSSDAPARKSPAKRLLMFGLPFILLLLIGGGGYVYATHTPTYILSQAYEKVKTVKTMSYDATFKANFKYNFSLPLSTYSASGAAPLQYSDPYSQSALPSSSPKSQLLLTLHMTGSSDFNQPQKHDVMVDASIGDGDLNSIGAGVEVRTINEVNYIRLSKVPDFGGLFDMSSLTNQWIKVDRKELEEEYPSLAEKKQTQELSEADVKKIQEMAKKAQIITVAKTLPSEPIAGENSYHYQLSIDKTKLKTFIADSSTILSKIEPQDASDKVLNDLIDNITFKNTEVWIGKKEGYTTRLLMEMSSNKESLGGDMSLTFDVIMKNINKPVNILQPVDAKDIKDVFKSMESNYSSMYASPSALPTSPNTIKPGSSPVYPNVLGDKTKRSQPANQLPTLTPAQSVMFYLMQKTLGM